MPKGMTRKEASEEGWREEERDGGKDGAVSPDCGASDALKAWPWVPTRSTD